MHLLSNSEITFLFDRGAQSNVSEQQYILQSLTHWLNNSNETFWYTYNLILKSLIYNNVYLYVTMFTYNTIWIILYQTINLE